MPIVINSPFSGKPVKVRDQDLGRAIRDEEGRIFYILPRSDGQGHYASPTRVGGAKEEARYIEMEQKTGRADTFKREQAAAAHDATGKRRSNPRGKLVILVLFLIVLAVVAVGYQFRDKWQKGPPGGLVPLDGPTTPATE